MGLFFRKSIDYRVNSSPPRVFDYLQRSECELSLSLTSFLLIPLQRPLLNSCKKHNFEFECFWFFNLFVVTLMKYPQQLRLYDWVSYFRGASYPLGSIFIKTSIWTISDSYYTINLFASLLHLGHYRYSSLPPNLHFGSFLFPPTTKIFLKVNFLKKIRLAYQM